MSARSLNLHTLYVTAAPDSALTAMPTSLSSTVSPLTAIAALGLAVASAGFSPSA